MRVKGFKRANTKRNTQQSNGYDNLKNYRIGIFFTQTNGTKTASDDNTEEPRLAKQIDRTDALLGGLNVDDTAELPLHEPTGEKTRKTYDFTSKQNLALCNAHCTARALPHWAKESAKTKGLVEGRVFQLGITFLT